MVDIATDAAELLQEPVSITRCQVHQPLPCSCNAAQVGTGTQHRWVQEHITGRYRNTAQVGTGTQHRWVQEHSTGRYRNTAQTGTGTQHRQVQEQVGTGTQHRQVQERSTGRYRHMKTSDHARHFSNQCDIYKVASVVPRNNQTTTVIGQVHSLSLIHI